MDLYRFHTLGLRTGDIIKLTFEPSAGELAGKVFYVAYGGLHAPTQVISDPEQELTLLFRQLSDNLTMTDLPAFHSTEDQTGFHFNQVESIMLVDRRLNPMRRHLTDANNWFRTISRYHPDDALLRSIPDFGKASTGDAAETNEQLRTRCARQWASMPWQQKTRIYLAHRKR